MSRVAAIAMMRDEEDVATHVVRHIVEERVDVVIVADNNSTDSTRDQLDALVPWVEQQGSQLVVVDDPEEGYYQSRKMTALAARAHHEFGADWIIPFDADELWFYRGEALGDRLRRLRPQVKCVGGQLFNHFATGLDENSSNPFEAMTWRQAEPGALPKVAVRWHETLVIHQGNHSAAYGGNTLAPEETCELRHFPYRSFEHFVRKARNGAAAYAKATDLGKHEGAHWRQYGALLDKFGEDTLRDEVWNRYFHFVAPTHGGLIHDPAPFRRWSH